MHKYLNKRNLLFIFLTTIAIAMAFIPLNKLLHAATRGEYYSHIPLIPIVSIYFLFQKRKKIFTIQEFEWKYGVFLLILGMSLYYWANGRRGTLSLNDLSTILTLSSLIFWFGGFIFCYGWRAFHLAIFPILFLLFIVPIPEELMDLVIYYLQVGSTEFTHLFFSANRYSLCKRRLRFSSARHVH